MAQPTGRLGHFTRNGTCCSNGHLASDSTWREVEQGDLPANLLQKLSGGLTALALIAMVASRNNIARVMKTATNKGDLMIDSHLAFLVAVIAAMLVLIQNGLPLFGAKARTISGPQAGQTAVNIQEIGEATMWCVIPTSLIRSMTFLVGLLPRLVVFKNVGHMFAVISLFVAFAAKSIDDLTVQCSTLPTRTFG